MGITLDPSSMQKNNSLKFVAKLALNRYEMILERNKEMSSGWGKLGESASKTTVEFATIDRVVETLQNSTLSVQSWIELKNDRYLLAYRPISEEDHSPRFGNLPIAIFVCSAARLKLYELLERSGGSAIYTGE